MSRVIEITDPLAPELDIYARLTSGQLLRIGDSAEHGLFIAESPNVILRALEAGYEPVSFLMERKHTDGNTTAVLAKCGDIPVYTADPAVLKDITGISLTRGVLAAMKRRKLPTPEEILGMNRVGEKRVSEMKRIVVLENVTDPTNVGALFRSAAALDMDAVLLTRGSCDPLYRRAARVSMGTVFQIPWAFIGEKPEEWREHGNELLHSLGFRTAALALDEDSVSIEDPVLRNEERLALILGAEGDGLLPSTIAESDYTVRIPMSRGVDSLNVAAAGAVAFWQLGRHGKSENTGMN